MLLDINEVECTLNIFFFFNLHNCIQEQVKIAFIYSGKIPFHVQNIEYSIHHFGISNNLETALDIIKV